MCLNSAVLSLSLCCNHGTIHNQHQQAGENSKRGVGGVTRMVDGSTVTSMVTREFELLTRLTNMSPISALAPYSSCSHGNTMYPEYITLTIFWDLAKWQHWQPQCVLFNYLFTQKYVKNNDIRNRRSLHMYFLLVIACNEYV